MKSVDVKVEEGPKNKVVLLKRNGNGRWHERGRKVSLKALYDGVQSERYNVEEWTRYALKMYEEYLRKKTKGVRVF